MNNTVQNTKLDWTKHLDESTCEPMWFSDSRAEFSIIQKGDVVTLSFTDFYTNYPFSYFVKIQKPANLRSVNELILYAQNFYDKNIFPVHQTDLDQNQDF